MWLHSPEFIDLKQIRWLGSLIKLSYVTGPFLLENIEVVLVCCCFLCRKENLHPLLSEKGGISQDQTIWEVSEATFFLKLGGGVETFS